MGRVLEQPANVTAAVTKAMTMGNDGGGGGGAGWLELGGGCWHRLRNQWDVRRRAWGKNRRQPAGIDLGLCLIRIVGIVVGEGSRLGVGT